MHVVALDMDSTAFWSSMILETLDSNGLFWGDAATSKSMTLSKLKKATVQLVAKRYCCFFIPISQIDRLGTKRAVVRLSGSNPRLILILESGTSS